MQHRSRSVVPARAAGSPGSVVPLVLVLAAAWPCGTVAQAVAGHVVEEGSGAPLAGAFVTLETPTGERVGGVLTDGDGGYEVRAHRAGRYRAVATLIGYGRARTEYLDLGAGDRVERTLELRVQALALEGIRAEVGERCRRGPDQSGETARLWDEARKALEIAEWSATRSVLLFQAEEYRKELELPGLEVTSESVYERRGYYDSSPYRSVSVQRLAAGGYIQQDAGGSLDYFAPDAAVLLSDWFLDGHCFRVAETPSNEPELVGLAFHPIQGTTQPDVEGVFWLDRGSAELRRLDFRYVRLPFDHGDWPLVGGRVEFERLANGVWIVRRWRIRMPKAAARDRRGRRTILRLVTVVEVGAEIVDVRTTEGVTLARAAGAAVYGSVTGPAGPLADALVEVAGAKARTRTDDRGRYRLSGLEAGWHRVFVDHEDLALSGAGFTPRRVRLVAGQATRLPIDVGLGPQRAAALCGDPGGRAVRLYGRVTGPDGSSAPGAAVVVRSARGETRVVGDANGVFRACVPPSPIPVRVAAGEGGGAQGEWREVAIDRPGFVRVDVVAAPVVAAAGPVSTAGGSRRLDRVGFYDRRAALDGLYLDREAVVVAGAGRMTELLERQPGIRLGPVEGGAVGLLLTLGAAGSAGEAEGSAVACLPALFVDDRPVPNAERGVTVLDELIDPDRVEGVEVYASPHVPRQYRGAGRCGVVLVWTRG
jgi:hypothetical protein